MLQYNLLKNRINHSGGEKYFVSCLYYLIDIVVIEYEPDPAASIQQCRCKTAVTDYLKSKQLFQHVSICTTEQD